MSKTVLRTAGIAGAIAVLLAACGSAPQEITVNSSDESSGISVTGIGEVSGVPDTVEVELGVSVMAESVGDASERAAQRADALISALTSQGVAEEDIATLNYSIQPEYDYSGSRERLVGYRVSNTVRAKLRDVETVGAVIDAATTAAGDEAMVHGLRFSIEEDSELITAARDAAWQDALAKATQLAELSGQELGPATSIVESVNMPPIPIPYALDRAMGGAEEASTPIEPGTSAVTITLQVEFGLGSGA